MKRLLTELKDRRIWRTLVAYPSMAFVLLQAVEFFVNNYGVDGRLLTATMVGAAAFLPAVLIWNWMHGEVGRQPFRRPEIAAYAVISVATVALVGWYWATAEPVRPADAPAPGPARSIAVLPFENPGEDHSVQYLCDGIAESLINWLASVPGIRVTSKSMAFRLRDRVSGPVELGRELGVEGIIQGRLEQVGEQVVVSAALVDARDGSQLWGERLARPVAEVIYLERSIVEAITGSLKLEVAGPDWGLLAAGGTDNAEAYRHYLQGRYLAQATTAELIDQGLEQLRLAIGIDPGFALPYATISEATIQRFYYGLTPSPGLIGEARTAAQSAIALAPGLAEAHTALAMLKLYFDFDWAGAEQSFEAAVALNPQTPVPYHRYADFLWGTLRFDRAREIVARAEAIDPIDSSVMHARGITELFSGNFSAAAEAFIKWGQYYPQIVWAEVKEGTAWALDGQCDRAVAAAGRSEDRLQGSGSALIHAWLARLYFLCGQSAAQQRAVAAIQTRIADGVAVDPMARYTLLQLEGDIDGLVAFIREMVDQRMMNVPFLQISRLEYMWPPDQPTVRDDPRFLEILRQLDFPPTPWSVPRS